MKNTNKKKKNYISKMKLNKSVEWSMHTINSHSVT